MLATPVCWRSCAVALAAVMSAKVGAGLLVSAFRISGAVTAVGALAPESPRALMSLVFLSASRSC